MNLLLSFCLTTIPAAKTPTEIVQCRTHRVSLKENVLVSSFSQIKYSLLSPCSLKYFLYFFFGGIKCIKNIWIQAIRSTLLRYFESKKIFWSLILECQVLYIFIIQSLSDYWSSFMVFLKNGDVLLDIIRGAHHHRYPLMDVLGLDVQDVGGPCGGHSSGLLHDEGHGVALIEKSELKRVKEFYKSHYLSKNIQLGLPPIPTAPSIGFKSSWSRHRCVKH